jgi:hypothetical protein
MLTVDKSNSILGINGVDTDRFIVYFEEGFYKIISLDNIISIEEDYYSEATYPVPGFDSQKEKIVNIWMFNNIYHSVSVDIEGQYFLRSWGNNHLLSTLPVSSSFQHLPQINQNLTIQFYIDDRNQFHGYQNGESRQLYLAGDDALQLMVRPEDIIWKHNRFLNYQGKYLALVPCVKERLRDTGVSHVLASFEIQESDKFYCQILSDIYIENSPVAFPQICMCGDFIVSAVGQKMVLFKPRE